MAEKKVLGILGGLGPAASVYFYDLITRHTLASRDRDHLDVIVVSAASTPDRTAYITGKSKDSPLGPMKKAAGTLYRAGAEIIAVPCNTAQYFFDELQKSSPVPIMNIVRETAANAKRLGAKRVGVLATDGTIISGSYKSECERLGMEYAVPDEDGQRRLMDIIYKSIKTASPPDIGAFDAISDELFARGCDFVILGCTELSLLPKDKLKNADKFIDSLLVLTCRAITECGGVPTGFDEKYII